MIAGDRKSCNANKISISVRPPMCHSREGGNPYSTSLRGEFANLEDGYPAHAEWIPAFAGMTGWPTGWPRARATSGMGWLTHPSGMPVKAAARGQRLASRYPVSLRLPRYAWPRSRLGAAPSIGKQNVGWVEARNPTFERCASAPYMFSAASRDPHETCALAMHRRSALPVFIPARHVIDNTKSPAPTPACATIAPRETRDVGCA